MKTKQQGSAPVDATTKHWATRLAAARTPAERAAVEWDRARAAVRDLPEPEQPQAWRNLIAAVEVARQKIEDR